MMDEEYLLPYWLEHHLRVFDHGIIIDYNSTDRSLEIVKSMAPTWEVVKSDVDHFGAADADRQVMEIEKRVEGWKIALNITEFLVHPDLKGLVDRANTSLTCKGVYLVDPEQLVGVALDERKPLLYQRTYGMYESEGLVEGAIPARGRLLHSSPCGHYTLGRHTSPLPSINEPDLLCVWAGFAPLTEEFIKRKLQIRGMIPEEQIRNGGGIAHASSEHELFNGRFGWKAYLPKTRNLLEDEHYNRIWNCWYGK